MQLTISGSVPSKKNSRITTASGRSFPNKTYMAWEKDALTQLALQKWEPITKYPVQLTVVFYVKDRVHRDLDNMLSSILDVLKDHKVKGVIVRQGVIQDDSWRYVSPITVSVEGVSKCCPRAEIYIESIANLT